MSDQDITEILDTFYFVKNRELDLPQEYTEFGNFEAKMEAIFAEMDDSALSDEVENTDVGASRFLRYLVDGGCLEKKTIPYSEPVYRFALQSYRNLRQDHLGSSSVYADSKEVSGYFTRVFDGYMKQDSELADLSKGEVVSQEDLREVDWLSVSKAHGDDSIAGIKQKIVELASAIQQAEIDDRLRGNLLSRVRAVDALIAAPDPEWKKIVELLNIPNLTAFLNAYAIIQIILLLAK